MGAKIMGFIQAFIAACTAIAEFFKWVNTWFVDVWKDFRELVLAVKKYVQDKNQREHDAQQAIVDAKLKAADAQASKEIANWRAWLVLEKEIWLIRYRQILECLAKGKPEDVLIMTEMIDHDAVNNVLFFTNHSNEVKAKLIVQIMQQIAPKEKVNLSVDQLQILETKK